MTDFEIINDKYPRLGQKILGLWGEKECRILLCDLLNDSRDGQREGFPKEVASAIFRVLHTHDTEFPQFDDSDDVIIPYTSLPSPTRYVPPDTDDEFHPIVKMAAALVVVGLVLMLARLIIRSGILPF